MAVVIPTCPVHLMEPSPVVAGLQPQVTVETISSLQRAQQIKLTVGLWFLEPVRSMNLKVLLSPQRAPLFSVVISHQHSLQVQSPFRIRTTMGSLSVFPMLEQ